MKHLTVECDWTDSCAPESQATFKAVADQKHLDLLTFTWFDGAQQTYIWNWKKSSLYSSLEDTVCIHYYLWAIVNLTIHPMHPQLSLCETGSFTLALGEDVCGWVLLPIRAPGWKGAQHPRVQLGQGADAQGQRLVYKRSPHIIHLEGRCRFTIQQQNLIPCFQTWWRMKRTKQGEKCEIQLIRWLPKCWKTAIVSFKSGFLFKYIATQKTDSNTSNAQLVKRLSVRPWPNNKAPSNTVAFLWAINSRVLMCTNDRHKQNFSAILLNSGAS